MVEGVKVDIQERYLHCILMFIAAFSNGILAIKKKEIISFAEKWMERGLTILNKIS
jgi:hypothetical protein